MTELKDDKDVLWFLTPDCLMGQRADIAEELYDLALAYEAWEAKVILDSQCWEGELPHITQELWDELLEIQGRRNKALAKARGE